MVTGHAGNDIPIARRGSGMARTQSTHPVVARGAFAPPITARRLLQGIHGRVTTRAPCMAIDCTFPPEIDELRLKVRRFVNEKVRPSEAEIEQRANDRRFLVQSIIEMRVAAKD